MNRQHQCGFTLYGWDGDTLAWESTIADEDGFGACTTHYVYEPGTFVPVAQALRADAILLPDEPRYGAHYLRDNDPLWLPPPPAPAIDSLARYQCDHLGTPQVLTDRDSGIVWNAEYRAWGMAKESIRTASGSVELRNPIRFQGQYHDPESGLHYNRYRYYDPEVGRFVSKDPIGYAGGLNVHQYAPNPVEWVDPLGLSGNAHQRRGKARAVKRQEALDAQTAGMIQQPDYPLDKVYDAVHPNKKIWQSFSPYDYSMECYEWEYENPSKMCTRWDEKPGMVIGRSTDSIPAKAISMPLPRGMRCSKPRMKDDPNKAGSASTADWDDFMDAFNKVRRQTNRRGKMKCVIIFVALSLFVVGHVEAGKAKDNDIDCSLAVTRNLFVSYFPVRNVSQSVWTWNAKESEALDFDYSWAAEPGYIDRSGEFKPGEYGFGAAHWNEWESKEEASGSLENLVRDAGEWFGLSK